MKKIPTVSIVIPTFNERGGIKSLVQEIIAKIKHYTFEIIIVDDMSTDGTEKTLKKLCQKYPQVRFFSHQPPRGLADSIRMGISHAKGKIVVGMDGDFNHDPSILESVITPVYTNKADLVVASRFISGGGMQDVTRYWITFAFNYLLKYLFSFPIFDNASGYYAIKKKTLLTLQPADIYQGYGEYHLRLVYKAMKANLHILETPVYYRNRMYGQSKSKLLEMVVTYIYEAYKLRMNKI